MSTCEFDMDVGRPDIANHLNPYVTERILNFLLFYGAVSDRLGLQEPVVVKITLARVAGWTLQEGIFHRGTWNERQHIELSAMQFPYPMNCGMAAKHIADRIWNAFGLDRCPLFDERGTFVADALRDR